jgi:hypothetical protein
MATLTLFSARNFGPRRPAWHHLGKPNTTSVSARDAFHQAGAYDVLLRPAEEPDLWKICRGRMAADDCVRIFGRVGADFTLVPPDELTELWDVNVAQPVETLGALGLGRCLFVTTKLPSMDVRGDILENYLVLAHWMDPSGRTEVFHAPVRVVCQNTLRMAQRLASERVILSADRDVRERLAESLKLAIGTASEHAATLQAQCIALAQRDATRAAVAWVLQAAFPADRARQAAAMELFEGAGTGMDTPAARGTLWGLYNAVAELENFREGDTLKQAAASVMVGARGAAMKRAFAAALECSTWRLSARRVATQEASEARPGLESRWTYADRWVRSRLANSSRSNTTSTAGC